MWDDLAGEVDATFASFTMDAVDDRQLDLFTWHLRDQARRRESHRERQRIAQRIQPVAVRKATNASRKSYWADYRRAERQANPERVERDRAAARVRMARNRAEARAA